MSESTPEELPRSVPIFQNGRYANPASWDFTQKAFTDVLKWKLRSSAAPFPSQEELEAALPLIAPDTEKIQTFRDTNPAGAVQTTWIGHSTFLVQMEGYNILTDPVFYQRCSPFTFMGPKRYRDPSIQLTDLPPIDAVVVSHDHYDHLDASAIQHLAQNSPDTGPKEYYVCQGMRDWFQGFGIAPEKIHDLTWWEEHQHSDRLSFVSTPCQHWTRRTLTNTMKALWGSWTIVGASSRVYFAGDTGYCPGFKEIGEAYGPFDVSLIPIGAYCPRWFMKCAHVNPKDAVKIHKDLKSKLSIGMHWGTFVLTDEHVLEPPQKLAEAREKFGVPDDQFVTVRLGEVNTWRDGQLVDLNSKE